MAVAILFTASCAKEDISSSIVGGGEVEMTFTVDLPELGTRANTYGNGANATLLRYYVFDAANGAELEALRGTATRTSGNFTFTLPLLKGMKYNIALWADQNVGTADNPEGFYDFDGKVVTVDYVNANDNNRDAFYHYEPNFDPTDPRTTTFTLYRPFAQLNAAVSAADKEAVGKNEVTLTTSTVKVTTYTQFDIAAGDVVETSKKEVAFTATDMPFKAGEELKSGYTYVSMNYLLAPKTGMVSNVEFTLNATKNGGNFAFTGTSYNDVPLKQNFRTNILGALLTAPTNFTVEIEAEFDEPAETISVWDGKSKTAADPILDDNGAVTGYNIDSASDLAWLADLVNGVTRAAGNESLNIVLSNDIDLAGHNWTPIGFNANEQAGNEKYFTGTFNGNGHTISNLNIDVKDQGGVGFFGAIYNATIKNITFKNVSIKAVESESNPNNTSGAEGSANYIVGGHIGAVAGYDAKNGNIVFENVHVNGLIKIEGETRAAQGQRIAGIFGGKNSSKVTFNNVSVLGDENSYIKGYCSTAGISGQTQDAAIFDNVHTDIDIYAVTFGAGGLAGIVRQGSTFTNCSSKGNITLDASKTQLSSYTANYPYRVGGIAGCWSESKTGVLTLVNCSYEGNLTSIDKDGNSPENLDYAGYVGRGYTLNNCAGSKVVIDGVEYVQAYDNVHGYYIVDGVYEIGTAATLKAFAAKVNGGESYEDKNVVLVADIDLNNAEWTPIGSINQDRGFCGNFDGNGKKIKNLMIHNAQADSDGYVYAGLFGITENNTIKNFVIENVDINTNGHIVAAAIAYPYYTTVENITVQGDVKIVGGDYTAGVLSYTRRCENASNLTINGNNGSVITGNQTVGGVISDIQMNGGLTAFYSNFAATGLTITGKINVGGISGIISAQTLDGATVENVNIVCDDARKGIVSGSLGQTSTIKNIVYNNVTGAENVVGATWKDGKEVYATGDLYTDKPIVGTIVECAGQKAIVFSVENGIKAVSIAEQNLNGKYWQSAVEWAADLGTGWALASMEELNAIYDVRVELNDYLKANSTDNALFWEGDELYRKNGSIYYALYMSSTEVPAGEKDANGNEYFPNRVFFKMFNKLGYSDVLYSAFDCINKYAPLRDNYFARAVYTIE